MRKYFVIIVHYGDRSTTDQTLDSIAACSDGPDDIVVINHDTKPYHTEHVACNVIQAQNNSGYGGGINRGLGWLITRDVVAHDIIVCCNNDLIVAPDTFTQLRSFWNTAPQLAVLSVAVTEAATTVASGHINLITGRASLANATPGTNKVPKNSFGNLNYIHGALVSAPYKVFMNTKGWPEHFFMYWEDSLFSQQALKLDVPLYTTNTISVTHNQRKTATKRNNQLYYLVRNGALFLEQETPTLWRHYWWVANRARLLYHTVRPNTKPIVTRALRDAVRGQTGPTDNL